ncbi:MAG TPA: secretin and TonB N-terminal domain-containing protein, partial [Chroococcales cyanobacterium]
MALSVVLAMSSPSLSVYAADSGTENAGVSPVPGSVNPDAPIDPPADAGTAPQAGAPEAASGIHLTFTPPGGTAAPAPANQASQPKSTAGASASPTASASVPDKTAIAQSQPLTTGASHNKNHLPTVTGTVTMRKPFKLVAKESLIHNISFRDTPVKEVLAEIARRGNLNVIFDKSVTGTITGEMRDVTLNEAFDSVLAAAGLQTRVMDNNTVIVASPAALIGLGLGRTTTRAFKLSYAHPYDIANLLQSTIFNKGAVPYLMPSKVVQPGVEPDSSLVKDPTTKLIRGTSRSQTQEGIGFNNAATDPGSQQIRASNEITTDFQIDQNGGGPIAIPDVKNRQVIVIGSVDDVAVAEEAIHLLDRRPTQVHIQASLVELSNAGIRQLGANLAVQGDGASSSILGNSAAPLVQFLPGLGSPFSLSPPALPFGNNVTPTSQTTAFTGLVGSALPLTAPSIAGVNAETVAQSAFNF